MSERVLTLLGLVSQSAGLVGSGGSWSTVEVGQLAVLPAPDTEQKAHHIGLLLAPQLLHIPICSHVDLSEEEKYSGKLQHVNTASYQYMYADKRTATSMY